MFDGERVELKRLEEWLSTTFSKCYLLQGLKIQLALKFFVFLETDTNGLLYIHSNY